MKHTRFFVASALLGAVTCTIAAPKAKPNAGRAGFKPVAAPRGIQKPALKSDAPAQYGAWRSAKIGGGGFVQNIIPTSNPQIFYTHIDVGGAYRSDDGGKRWRMLHGGLPSDGAMYHIRALSVHPSDPNDVLVAGGTQWAPVAGIFRSCDGGKTWKKVQTARFYGNEPFRWAGEVIARDPKNGNRVLAGSGGDGIFASSDGGATWQKLGLEGVYFTDLKFDRANSKRIWAAAQPERLWRDTDYVDYKGGFFRSDDGGATWKKLSDSSPMEILQDPKNPAVLYGTLPGSGEEGRFAGRAIGRSTDGGATWAEFSDGLPIGKEPLSYTSESAFNALAAGPDFVLTASTRGTFYRLPSGQTKWQKIERQGVVENYEGQKWVSAMAPGKWQHFGASLGAITVDPRDPKRWFFSDWFAIYQTRDAGKNWTLSMDGLEDTVLHALLPDPSDSGMVHLGMADNGYFWSEDGGARFTKPGDLANCKTIALSPLMPTRIYATGDRGNGSWRALQVWVSTNRGHSWTRSPMTGLPDMEKFSCNSIAVAPDDPFTVYLGVSGGVKAGEGGVYRSVDGGKTWSFWSAGLPDNQNIFAYNIWAIGRELAANTGGVLCAMSRDGKAVYRFDGQKWILARSFQNQPMSVVAGAKNTFFVGVKNEGVYRSNDGGANWDLVWKGDAAHLSVDPGNPQLVAAGVADGVIWSRDGGTNWQWADKNLPQRNAPIVAISGDRIYAGTFGSGAFWMPISEKGKTTLAARPLETLRANAQVKPLQIVKNGDMSAGAETPDEWSLWTGSGAPKLSRDTQNFQAGPASLRLDGGAGAYGSASQSITLSDKPFSLSGFLRTTPKIEESNVAIQVFDAGNKQIEWIQISSGPTDDKWVGFQKNITLPQGAVRANLITTIKGEGTIWLDEIQTKTVEEIWKPDATLATNPPAQTPVAEVKPLPAPNVTLQNGDMSGGTGAPEGWNQGWTASGKLNLARDTTDFKSGPASLRLESVGGVAQGGASTPLGGKGAFKLSGVVKSSGQLEEAIVAVQSFTADGKQAGWTTLADAKGKTDWTEFWVENTIPENATYAQIVVILKGDGKIWLDELKSN